MHRRDWLRLAVGTSLASLPACSAGGNPQRIAISSSASRMLGASGSGFAIWQGGRLLESGGSSERLGSLSLTKSIAALAVVRAVAEGWLSLDVSLNSVIPEWNTDPAKSRVTVRMLVNQSAGFPPSPTALYRGKIPHKGKVAIALPLAGAPGTRFRYGPASWEILAEVLHRRLSAQGGTLEDFITEIIRRIGLSSPDWRKDGAGRFYLSTGAQFSIRELGRLGRTLGHLASGNNDSGFDAAIFRDLASPRSANPMFGAGIWWNRSAAKAGSFAVEPERALDSVRDPSFWNRACLSVRSDPSWFALVGSGGKRVYVLPEKELVIVRLGRAYGWNDGVFLSAISA